MFVGHYAFALVINKRRRKVPLWLLFVSVQLSDILLFVLVLLGVERVGLYESENPFMRLAIEYVPYSHALFFSLALAGIVYAVLNLTGKDKWAGPMALGVASHWFFDLIVHIPDLPLFFDSHNVGLGLWSRPVCAFYFELLLLMSAGIYFLKQTRKVLKPLILIGFLAAGFMGMFFAPAVKGTPAQAAGTSLFVYAFYTAMAWWVHRKKRAVRPNL